MSIAKFMFLTCMAIACLQGPLRASETSAIKTDTVSFQGVFVAGGVECPLFEVDDGRVFALQGIDRTLVQIGAKAILWGHERMISTCQQGPAFQVERMETVAP